MQDEAIDYVEFRRQCEAPEETPKFIVRFREFVKRKQEKWAGHIKSLKRPKLSVWDWRDDIIYNSTRFHLAGSKSIRHWRHLKNALFKKDEEYWVPPIVPHTRKCQRLYNDLFEKRCPPARPLAPQRREDFAPWDFEDAAGMSAGDVWFEFTENDEAGPSGISAAAADEEYFSAVE